MNCKEFEWAIIDRVNFKININFDVQPYWTGDITLSANPRAHWAKRVKSCPNSVGPKVRDAFCNRWDIIFGFEVGPYDVATYPLNLSGVTPELTSLDIEFDGEHVFKPWNDTDPFYGRALAMWEARSARDKVFWFTIIGLYGESYFVTFEDSADGQAGIITDRPDIYPIDPKYPPVQYGTALLTIHPK